MSVSSEIQDQFKKVDKYKDIRNQYIEKLEQITGNNILIYATDFLSIHKPGPLAALTSDDKYYICDIAKDLDKNKDLDIIIESPGGLGEVAASIADILHSIFKDKKIRFIVPNMAKSAATLLCCGGNEIVMDYQSELGPIDPQMIAGDKMTPAAILIKQFESLLLTIIQNPPLQKLLADFLIIYFPSLLQECHIAQELSKKIAIDLLKKYMFFGDNDCKQKSEKIAQELSEFDKYLSHTAAIDKEKAKQMGLKILDLSLDENSDFSDAVNRLYASIRETFKADKSLMKIVENKFNSMYFRYKII